MLWALLGVLLFSSMGSGGFGEKMFGKDTQAVVREAVPDRARAEAAVETLKKGDKVITASGIWGTVTNLGKETVTLQIADSAKIRIQREHIARLRADDEDKDKDS